MDKRNKLYREYEKSKRDSDMIRYLIECNRVGSLTIPFEQLSLWLAGDHDSRLENMDKEHLDILSFLYDDFMDFIFFNPNNPLPDYNLSKLPRNHPDRIAYRRDRRLYQAKKNILKYFLGHLGGSNLVNPCLRVFLNRQYLGFNYEQIDGQCYQLLTFPPKSDWLLPIYDFIQTLTKDDLGLYNSPHSQRHETKEEYDSRFFRHMILGSLKFSDKNFKNTFLDFFNRFLLGEFNFENTEVNTNFLQNIVQFQENKLLSKSLKKLVLEILETGSIPDRYQIYSNDPDKVIYHILYSLRMMDEIKFIESVEEDVDNFIMNPWGRGWTDELYENLNNLDWEIDECPWEAEENEEQEWQNAYGDGY